MHGTIKPISLVVLLALTGCTTVTDKMPIVKIERKNPKTIQTVKANYTKPKVAQAEAAMVCENDNMRSRSRDNNSKNDSARVLILEEDRRSSTVIADVEVNCRDYFQTAHKTTVIPASTSAYVQPNQASYVTSQSIQLPPEQVLIQNSHTQRVIQPASRPQQARVLKTSASVQPAKGYFYSIKKGDTMYRIAQDNCSSVQDISALNGIYDPTKIEVHQIIRLPAKKCNARK